MNHFYTYAWLREDRTPYYIGKGKGKRAWRKESPTSNRVLILKNNLTEQEAFKHEIYMIAVLGRKDTSAGMLINLTDGGDGLTGRSGPLSPTWGLKRPDLSEINRSRRGKSMGEEFSKKMSDVTSGKNNPMYGRSRPDLAQRNRDRTGSTLKPGTIEKMKLNRQGRFWITNQKEERWVNANDSIPDGWETGRIKGRSRKRKKHAD